MTTGMAICPPERCLYLASRLMIWLAALCVTFSRDLSPEEVFTRYGAEPDRARPLDDRRLPVLA
ncbi:hypothetical protein [Streptomyces sp. LRE541]|uniref:hypothetical protein n=2 Tax=unclassified Streptomyces TaxID=2593676 RepID=UPI0032C4473F